jgi:hypothetical protein
LTAFRKSDAIWWAYLPVVSLHLRGQFLLWHLSSSFTGVQAPLAQLSARALRNDRSLHECLNMLMQATALLPVFFPRAFVFVTEFV